MLLLCLVAQSEVSVLCVMLLPLSRVLPDCRTFGLESSFKSSVAAVKARTGATAVLDTERAARKAAAETLDSMAAAGAVCRCCDDGKRGRVVMGSALSCSTATGTLYTHATRHTPHTGTKCASSTCRCDYIPWIPNSCAVLECGWGGDEQQHCCCAHKID